MYLYITETDLQENIIQNTFICMKKFFVCKKLYYVKISDHHNEEIKKK